MALNHSRTGHAEFDISRLAVYAIEFAARIVPDPSTAIVVAQHAITAAQTAYYAAPDRHRGVCDGQDAAARKIDELTGRG